jgi:tRNA(Ile)-lysidine synthase
VRVLLLGHTADDAAETVVMRAARLSPGVSDRVAFAQPQLLSLSPLWPEGRSLLLARPLLGQARATLQDWLRAQGHTWAEDPTNADPERERARARAWLGGAPARREAALRLWRAGLRARRGVMAELADLTPTFAPDGSVEVAADGVPARALTLLLAVASGSPRLPALSVAEAVLDALASGQTSLTRAGVLVRKRAERLVLSRDSGALADGGGRRVDGVWDGRFSVTAAQSGDDTLIAPVGLLDHLPPDLRLALLAHPPDVRATLPALWRGGACEGLAPLAPLTGLRWRQLTWDGRGEAPLAKPGAGGLGQAR